MRRSLPIALALLLVPVADGPGSPGLPASFPAPSFRPAVGGWVLTTGPTDGRQLAPETWAASDRGSSQLGLFDLFIGLRKLTDQGIVIWATTSGKGEATSVFTRTRWPVRLPTFRVDHGWEGQPAGNVQQRLRWMAVGGWHLDLRVYFGSQHPTETVLRKAQAELDRLVPPGRR